MELLGTVVTAITHEPIQPGERWWKALPTESCSWVYFDMAMMLNPPSSGRHRSRLRFVCWFVCRRLQRRSTRWVSRRTVVAGADTNPEPLPCHPEHRPPSLPHLSSRVALWFSFSLHLSLCLSLSLGTLAICANDRCHAHPLVLSEKKTAAVLAKAFT